MYKKYWNHFAWLYWLLLIIIIFFPCIRFSNTHQINYWDIIAFLLGIISFCLIYPTLIRRLNSKSKFILILVFTISIVYLFIGPLSWFSLPFGALAIGKLKSVKSEENIYKVRLELPERITFEEKITISIYIDHISHNTLFSFHLLPGITATSEKDINIKIYAPSFEPKEHIFSIKFKPGVTPESIEWKTKPAILGKSIVSAEFYENWDRVIKIDNSIIIKRSRKVPDTLGILTLVAAIITLYLQYIQG